MSSPHSIAREGLDAAFAAASEAGIDEDRLTKALVSQLLTRWAARRPVADVRSAVEFELEHMGGDTEIEFMRP
jgi:3-hydroxyisobutyrate dehydrogenase-like beta-hydroxyacid dehydrogenase